MTTNKQTKARTRNWAKARLMGFILDINSLSAEESYRYGKIKLIIKDMLDNWDKNTVEVGFKPRKKKEYEQE